MEWESMEDLNHLQDRLAVARAKIVRRAPRELGEGVEGSEMSQSKIHLKRASEKHVGQTTWM